MANSNIRNANIINDNLPAIGFDLIYENIAVNPTKKTSGFTNWFNNYNNKWGEQKYNLMNMGISAGADLAGSLINSNGFSTTAGNIMTGIGNIAGNIPGPIGWAGKGLALAGQAVNALWGHKFNDANVAAAESANRERNNWLFGDYSNTDALLAGSMANVQLGNVSKGFLGKEGPFSNAVTNKMNLINNDRMQANLRANNSELNAYNNYLTGMVRNAIAGDSMGSVNAAAAGGPLNMINGTMTPFGNRYFANGGYTHGGMFTNGFIEVNNGGSHELNPNQGVQYGVDPQGTPNMVEEGETILDDYVFSDRIKFPKKYKNEFSLGGKLWKKTFADISKLIAKESEERPNDPISQRSLKAMGGKLADIQEEVKVKQALDKMDPREVMAMLQQFAMMQQGGQPLIEQQQMMQDPYLQAMMMGEQLLMVAACGGKIRRFDNGGNINVLNLIGYTPFISATQPQELDLLNLFKKGGKTKSRYKSDNDWEQMYELSKPMYKQFIDAGIDPLITVGVLGNIALESSFNHKASNKTHWGYVQNDKTLRDYIISNYGGYEPLHQIQFLIDGLTKGIKGSDKGKGKAIQKRFTNFLNAAKGVTDPADIAKLWDDYYEISGGQALYDRKNYANKFWEKYNTSNSTSDLDLLMPTNEYISNFIPQDVINYADNWQPDGDFAVNNADYYLNYDLLTARNSAGKRKNKSNKTTTSTNTTPLLNILDYGFLKDGRDISKLSKMFEDTDWNSNKSIAKLLNAYVDNDIFDGKYAIRLFSNILNNNYPGKPEDMSSKSFLMNLLGMNPQGYKDSKDKDAKTIPWVGKSYWDALLAEGDINEFNLNRGFSDNFGEGYSDLSQSFNFTNAPKDILKLIKKYFEDYGSTDKNVVDTYKNKDIEEKRKFVLNIISKNNDILNQLSNIYGLSISPTKANNMLIGDWDEEDTVDPRVNPYLLPKDELQQALLNSRPFSIPLEKDKNGKVITAALDNKLNAVYNDRLNLMSQYYDNLDQLNSELYRDLYEKETLLLIDDEIQRGEYRTNNQSVYNYHNLPTWMRYAPLAFSSIATLTDALGLTNKPDLTPYNQLIALSDRFNKTPIVRSHPVFQPMLYLPINLNYDLGLANNLYANTSRAIDNTANGNIGAAIAGNLVALNNAGSNYAKIRQAVNELNIANLKNVMDYNNRGAYQDAMASLEALKINSANQQNAQRFSYQALLDALRYYQAEQQAANAARQVNLTHAVNSWANVGRENMYMNMINDNKAFDYYILPNGMNPYKWFEGANV